MMREPGRTVSARCFGFYFPLKYSILNESIAKMRVFRHT